jgi:[protein-PII] uridylyltransferase
VTGRLHDVYDFEVRHPAARWLGSEVASLGRRLLRARSNAEALVDEQWPEVAPARSKSTTKTGFIGGTRRAARGDIVSWWRTGPLDNLPEVRRLLDEPHVVPFHRFAVADHVAAAIDRAWELVDGEFEDPIAREVISDLPGPELVVWAALLHDIGKGLEGDHSRLGARAIPAVARRMGLPPDDAETLRRLVEHHLLLADLATKFDSDDPAVLAWAADRIVDRRTLRFLYLLTVADSRATGSDTWSPWRAELLRRAYRRLERELARRSIPEELAVAVLADRVLDVAGDDVSREEVMAHLAGLSEIYRSSHSPEVIRDHVLMARDPLGPGGGTVAVFLGVPVRIVVMATDRPRLLVDVAGVMAVHRFSIIDARFATRADGRVFDTFEIVDAGGSKELDPARLERLATELRRALRGGLDVSRSVAAKQHAYRDTARKGVAPVISVRRSEGGGGRVEVECADRLGLLHDIGAVFDRFGMPVLRARIDTRSAVAYDIFQVARIPADVTDLERALLAAVS